jgi:hypothetical protein
MMTKTKTHSQTPPFHLPVNDFTVRPVGMILQPLIQEAVQECGLAKVRKGTKLPPIFVIWIVLFLTLRRDLNGHQVINWLLSGWRWIEGCLPAASQLISDGALSHARERVGTAVFSHIFQKLRRQHPPHAADFHGRTSAAFDGSTGTMPDTPSNRTVWGKPGSSRGPAAFPQMRFMGLLLVATRTLWDVAYAPYRGKGTGERALMQTIVRRLGNLVLLLLLDAGLYSFEMVWMLQHYGHDVIVKVPKSLKLSVMKRLPDGSFLTRIMDSIDDLDGPVSPGGRRQWRTETLTLRAMRVQISGYRPWTLVTTLLDSGIPAVEIARHYHTRWDIEIAYDELKTHQCATLRGHCPTTFRSKRGDLVEQEFYAMVIMYTAIRLLMVQAAESASCDPRELSFLEALHHLVEAAPLVGLHDEARQVIVVNYFAEVVATARIDRPRRPRTAPRVIKVARSKFPRKRKADVCLTQDMAKSLEILVWQEKIAS